MLWTSRSMEDEQTDARSAREKRSKIPGAQRQRGGEMTTNTSSFGVITPPVRDFKQAIVVPVVCNKILNTMVLGCISGIRRSLTPAVSSSHGR